MVNPINLSLRNAIRVPMKLHFADSECPWCDRRVENMPCSVSLYLRILWDLKLFWCGFFFSGFSCALVSSLYSHAVIDSHTWAIWS